jgi:hypothetical protein
MSKTFGDLLAFVDFADFVLEKLVSLLTQLDNVGSLGAPF